MLEKCFCGRPLHYTNKEAETFVRKMIAERGEFIGVQVGSRVFNVPRHYIALHGLKGADVPRLGFQESKL